MEIKTLLIILIALVWISVGYISAEMQDRQPTPRFKTSSRIMTVILGPINALLYICFGR
jgi:hypothetical protein